MSSLSFVRRRDGKLLAQCLSDDHRNFQSLRDDNSKTWTPPRELGELKIGGNTDLDYAGKALVAHGRGVDIFSAVAYLSPDDGQTWGYSILLDRWGFYDRPFLREGGGYTPPRRALE